MLIIEATECVVFGNFLYYLYNFSVSLKVLKNKSLLELNFVYCGHKISCFGPRKNETFSIWQDTLLLFRVKISNKTRQNAYNYLLSGLEIKHNNKICQIFI